MRANASPAGNRLGIVAAMALVAMSGVAAKLAPVVPNPAHGPTRLSFTLPRSAAVALEVFDTQGRRVGVLARGELGAGEHEVTWQAPAARARPATFFARFRFPGGQQVRRFVVVR